MKSYKLKHIKKVLNDFAEINDLPKVSKEDYDLLNSQEVKLNYLMQHKKDMLFNLKLKKNVLTVSIELLERLID